MKTLILFAMLLIGSPAIAQEITIQSNAGCVQVTQVLVKETLPARVASKIQCRREKRLQARATRVAKRQAKIANALAENCSQTTQVITQSNPCN